MGTGGTVRKIVVGSGVLIGLYLALAHATDGGRLLSAGSSAANSYVRTLQGR